MRHNLHWGLGYYSPYIMMITILIIFVIVYLILKQKAPPNIYFLKLLDKLKEKYAEDVITYDEYIKRKNIIEEYEYLNPYSLILLERYATCEINIVELFNLKKVIENEGVDNSIREKLAKGVLSYDDYEKYNSQ